jgi:hypothetical protein
MARSSTMVGHRSVKTVRTSTQRVAMVSQNGPQGLREPRGIMSRCPPGLIRGIICFCPDSRAASWVLVSRWSESEALRRVPVTPERSASLRDLTKWPGPLRCRIGPARSNEVSGVHRDQALRERRGPDASTLPGDARRVQLWRAGPAKLAGLAKRVMRKRIPELAAALTGRFRNMTRPSVPCSWTGVDSRSSWWEGYVLHRLDVAAVVRPGTVLRGLWPASGTT